MVAFMAFVRKWYRNFMSFGLMDYGGGTRFYSPLLGRFISPDTVIDGCYETPIGLNRYAYTRNNPLKYTDPTGHIVFVPILIAVGAYVLKTALWTAGETAIEVGVDRLAEGKSFVDFNDPSYGQAFEEKGIKNGLVNLATAGVGSIAKAGKAGKVLTVLMEATTAGATGFTVDAVREGADGTQMTPEQLPDQAIDAYGGLAESAVDAIVKAPAEVLETKGPMGKIASVGLKALPQIFSTGLQIPPKLALHSPHSILKKPSTASPKPNPKAHVAD